jgi:hypothetical protein
MAASQSIASVIIVVPPFELVDLADDPVRHRAGVAGVDALPRVFRRHRRAARRHLPGCGSLVDGRHLVDASGRQREVGDTRRRAVAPSVHVLVVEARPEGRHALDRALAGHPHDAPGSAPPAGLLESVEGDQVAMRVARVVASGIVDRQHIARDALRQPLGECLGERRALLASGLDRQGEDEPLGNPAAALLGRLLRRPRDLGIVADPRPQDHARRARPGDITQMRHGLAVLGRPLVLRSLGRKCPN